MNTIYTGDTQHISNVYNGLVWLGSMFATRPDTVIKRNIKHIVSIGCCPQKIDGCQHHHFEVEDSRDDASVRALFETIMPQIHAIVSDCVRKREAVLVHCQAGMSRSAAVVIMWLVLACGMSYDAAYAHVKRCRPVISPNIGFVEYMERSCKKE
jgi:predicted protein tyrosine phosphatase